MKIALYGTKDGLEKREKQIWNCFQDADEEIQIDSYSDKELLMENLLQYDAVYLTDRLVDMATGCVSDKVVFEWSKKIRTFNINDIYYAEADLKNVHIWHRSGELLVHLPFSEVEQILGKGDFIKIHRSFIVNCFYVRSINKRTVEMMNGKELPLSKYRAAEVRKQYIEYMEKKQSNRNKGT